MDTVERLIAVADVDIDVTGMKPATVSLRAFQHASKLQALRNGSDIQVRFADEAFKGFAAHWPRAQPLPDILIAWCATHFAEALKRRAVAARPLQPSLPRA